jgi:hypothetical protein
MAGVMAVERLEEYRKFVASIAGMRDSKVIMNRDSDQTVVTISFLFSQSHRGVDFLTGCLNPVVYGSAEVIDAALEFLKGHPAARIRILTEQQIGSPHPFLRAIERAGLSGRVEVLDVPPALQEAYDYHFAVGDSCNFRYEPSRKSHEAFVKFGDESGGRRLQFCI